MQKVVQKLSCKSFKIHKEYQNHTLHNTKEMEALQKSTTPDLNEYIFYGGWSWPTIKACKYQTKGEFGELHHPRSILLCAWSWLQRQASINSREYKHLQQVSPHQLSTS